MAKGTSPWRDAARRLQTIVSCRASTVGTAELQRRIACIEHGYGVRLPPAYAEFLTAYDGWPRVFRGASLLSTTQLLDPGISHKSGVALAQLQLPGDGGSDDGPARDSELVPIGMDDDASIVMALDPSTERLDGEMDVVVWISGLGMRFDSFADLMDWLGDLADAERPSRSQAFAA